MPGDARPNAGSEISEGEETGAAKIADPENYNLRRRLKQLHDAKERVRNTAEHATHMEMTERTFSESDRDRLVAEAVADYIHELSALLGKHERDEEFLEEQVAEVNGEEITLEKFANDRGKAPDVNGWVPYRASMMAWSECNDYFEEVAGAEFEDQMGEEPGFDSTGGDR